MSLSAFRIALMAVSFVLAVPTAALAAACPGPQGFPAWLTGIEQEAAGQGISQATIQNALGGLTYDPNTISHDRGQKVFRQSFEQFSARMANSFRIKKGASLIRQYGPVFARIEQEFGVPAPVIASIWGLETDFGANIGSFSTIRSLATLAYDCRRSERFHAELLYALQIVDRGDIAPSAMHGAWAGEIGQTQFMPSSYLKYAVDFDGNGRRDLLRSVPDVLASTANYLKGYGWQRGQPWDPGTANFQVLLQWNASQVYSKTIALLADKIAGN